jgi:RNA polymerase sigma factor (TIGR02999 family)
MPSAPPNVNGPTQLAQGRREVKLSRSARMSTPPPDVTTLLRLAGGGDREAQEELYRLVEGELRQRARARLRQERPGHDLQTTVLVDEAYVQLVGGPDVRWENRSQFYGVAATVMRRMLVDEARQRAAAKRGGGAAVAPLEDVGDPIDRGAADPSAVLALNEALTRLGEAYPEVVQVVELHHFGGWDLKQIAEDVLHVPYTTIKRRWQRALALLHRELS